MAKLEHKHNRWWKRIGRRVLWHKEYSVLSASSVKTKCGLTINVPNAHYWLATETFKPPIERSCWKCARDKGVHD